MAAQYQDLARKPYPAFTERDIDKAKSTKVPAWGDKSVLDKTVERSSYL